MARWARCRPCVSNRARTHAEALLARPVEARGLLCGLSVPIKDLTEVAGVRTTHGSVIYADHVPEASDILVTHLEAEGAVVYAKSNTPELGAGANTFKSALPPKADITGGKFHRSPKADIECPLSPQ